MEDIAKRLRETLAGMAARCSVPIELWQDHSVAVLEAADRIEADAARIAELTDELHTMKTAGIVEVAVRNPSVMEYIKHWEDRAEAAEARVKVLEDALHLWISMMDDDTYDTGEMVVEFDRIARATLEGEK